MNKDINTCYKVLEKVYCDDCYINIALNSANIEVTPLLTKLVYGVVERDTELEYYLSKFIKSNTAVAAKVALKIGVYCLIYMDGLPDYTVVNECVELVAGDYNRQLKSLVNATLNKFIQSKIEDALTLPRDKFEALSVRFSKPQWLVKRYYKQFGEDVASRLLSLEGGDAKEHIRFNDRLLSASEFEDTLKFEDVEFSKSKVGGYYVKNCPTLKKMFAEGKITFQSPSSTLAVMAMPKVDNGQILDACASPGGKAVYLSEINTSSTIIACDVYQHRIELIEKYARRMMAGNIVTRLQDATEPCADMVAKFDAVLCDVPCSGMGVVGKKPDILLKTTYQDVLNLSELQYNILNNVIDYCKDGGSIVYSTCSTMREENDNVIARILKTRQDVILEVMDIPFENNGTIQILPSDEFDGFFIARLKKLTRSTN